MDTYITIGVIVVILLALSKFEMIYNSEGSDDPNNKEELPKKSIQLYSESGELLFEYKDVYISHWDKGIYHLSREYEGKSFLRIDKGRDMLLLEERYEEGEYERE